MGGTRRRSLSRMALPHTNGSRFAKALLRHASEHEVAKIERTPFGTRFVVDGTMGTPGGRAPNVRSVWFVESDQDTPRFVTAYPLEVAGDD